MHEEPSELAASPLPFSISEDLVPSTIKPPSQTVTLDFSGLLNPPLILQTNEKECGGQLWPAGMILAEYLLQHKMDELRGKMIVELGAGSGLVGLALAIALNVEGDASGSIHITDGLNALLPLMQENIDLNATNISSKTCISPAVLRWGKPILEDIPHHPDVLLAADCCYLEETFPLLLSTMEELIGEKTVCYFCYKRRRRADKDMMKMVRKVFEVREVEGRWQTERVFLYEIRRKNR